MTTKSNVQNVQSVQTIEPKPELKSERVQEEIALMAEGPWRISLKAERVQEPSAVAAGLDLLPASAFEMNLQLSGSELVQIEMTALETVITI